MKKRSKFDWFNIFMFGFMGVAVLGVLVYLGALIASFYMPAKTLVGYVTDRSFTPGYYSTTWYSNPSGGGYYQTSYIPPSYGIAVDGKWFDVDEEEYNSFHIGDKVAVTYKGIITEQIVEVKK